MDRQIQKIKKPDYKRIYSDMIALKFPEKRTLCEKWLSKKELSYLDVLEINHVLFDKTTTSDDLKQSQRHRSYDEPTILKILDYQEKNSFTDSQLANHFKLSRNSVKKWKELFSEQLK